MEIDNVVKKYKNDYIFDFVSMTILFTIFITMFLIIGVETVKYNVMPMINGSTDKQMIGDIIVGLCICVMALGGLGFLFIQNIKKELFVAIALKKGAYNIQNFRLLRKYTCWERVHDDHRRRYKLVLDDIATDVNCSAKLYDYVEEDDYISCILVNNLYLPFKDGIK